MDCDIAIRGGVILDGTGSEGFRGDVAIRDGRVAALGGGDAIQPGGRRETHAPGASVVGMRTLWGGA